MGAKSLSVIPMTQSTAPSATDAAAAAAGKSRTTVDVTEMNVPEFPNSPTTSSVMANNNEEDLAADEKKNQREGDKERSSNIFHRFSLLFENKEKEEVVARNDS